MCWRQQPFACHLQTNQKDKWDEYVDLRNCRLFHRLMFDNGHILQRWRSKELFSTAIAYANCLRDLLIFMLPTPAKLPRKKFDFTFIAPAVLCNLAFILGTIPALFCLNSRIFAYVSVAVFLFSIVIHIYILMRWTRYKDSSPLGYAIVQPALHMIMLVYALAVGVTNFCAPPPAAEQNPPNLRELPPPPDLSGGAPAN